MLDFFRRYQRYIYVVITIVIVISFSFFGTYSTLSNNPFREQIAFRNIAGSDVTRYELDEMVTFLSTDSNDKLYFGGTWGSNFLNDGVLRKDFLESGLAFELAKAYPDDIRSDLDSRLDKERRFNLYSNPQVKFVGVESVWKNFAPAMTSYYHVLKVAQDPLSTDALQARVALFLLDRKLPPQLVKQVIRYQEKQYSFIKPDPSLDYANLALFGYHTAEDWFGPRFIRLAAQFIMNASIIAEQRGYQVTKAEALADLIHNSQISYQQNMRNPQIGVASAQEYFNEQLRRMGMDQNIAAKVWRQVMLFRLLFNDLASSVLVDPFSIKQLSGYAMESVEGDLYHLPKDLRFNQYNTLQKFETYLDSVSKRTDDDKAKLTLPTTYIAAADISQKTPELVEKRYLLEIAHLDKKTLEGNVAMKETWNWEVSDKGWDKLKKEFPDLGTAKGTTRDERFASLDALDDKTRGRIDTYARKSIVEEHPDWVAKALEEAAPVKQAIGLHTKGGDKALPGLENGQDLIAILDVAPLKGEDAASIKPAAKQALEKLNSYSPDKINYFRITLIDRAPQAEVLTFADANQQGILDKLLDTKLETYYKTIREANAKDYQQADGSWKPFADVKSQVADKYFEKTLNGIKKAYAANVPADQVPEKMINDFSATLRFLPYVSDIKGKVQKDPKAAEKLTIVAEATAADKEAQQPLFEGDKLIAKPKLADQWKLEKVAYQTVRSSSDNILDKETIFTAAPATWTKVNTPSSGDVNFFFLEKKGTSVNNEELVASAMRVRSTLSTEAMQGLMGQLLNLIKAKNAISLSYLSVDRETD